MDAYAEKVKQTAQFIGAKVKHPPEIGLLTGTGLGDIANLVEPETVMEYAAVPNFPAATVLGHPGKLLLGTQARRRVMILQGRFHLYEGYSAQAVSFPIRVMQALGIRILILSNAAGGLNPAFRPGDIMVISDHVNLTGENPLVGANDERWGPRFPEMTAAYDTTLCRIIRSCAKQAGIALQTGVYAGLKGPSLETPAEVRFLRTIGADAVGFSTIMETIAAVHAGMQVLALSIITNLHDPDHPAPVSADAILETAAQAAPKLETLLAAAVRKIPT